MYWTLKWVMCIPLLSVMCRMPTNLRKSLKGLMCLGCQVNDWSRHASFNLLTLSHTNHGLMASKVPVSSAPCSWTTSAYILLVKISHPYKKEMKSLCILVFMFLDRKWKDKIFWTKWQNTFQNLICSISSNIQLWLNKPYRIYNPHIL